MPNVTQSHLDNAQAAFLDALDDMSSALLAAEDGPPAVYAAIQELQGKLTAVLGFYSTPRKPDALQAFYCLVPGDVVGLRAFEAIEAEARYAADPDDKWERAADTDVAVAGGR